MEQMMKAGAVGVLTKEAVDELYQTIATKWHATVPVRCADDRHPNTFLLEARIQGVCSLDNDVHSGASSFFPGEFFSPPFRVLASCEETVQTPQSQEMKQLLARAAVIQNACDLDLLVFLNRHPRMLLTSEQLAGFVGYPLQDIAKGLDMFIEAGLLGRTAQQSGHAARLFLLLLDGPQGRDVRALLKLALTRQGRQAIFGVLNHKNDNDSGTDIGGMGVKRLRGMYG